MVQNQNSLKHDKYKRAKFDFSNEHTANLVQLQAKDSETTDRFKLMNKEDIDVSPACLKILLSNIDDFIVVDGILQPRASERAKAEQCSLQLVVPYALRNEIMRELHCEVHFSYMKVWQKAKKRYWWPGMLKDIKLFSDTCMRCQQAKRPAKTSALDSYRKQLSLANRWSGHHGTTCDIVK